MHFLADECCDKGVVKALRANGYDVLSVSDISPRAGDLDVIRLAERRRGQTFKIQLEEKTGHL